MTGSDTFIMVALRCRDSSRPFARASSICSSKNARSAWTCITELSRISPATSGSAFLSTVTVPSAATNSNRARAGAVRVIEFSLP